MTVPEQVQIGVRVEQAKGDDLKPLRAAQYQEEAMSLGMNMKEIELKAEMDCSLILSIYE